MIMKRKLTYYVSALLFGAASLFAACSDEEALTPSGNDLNMFAVDENDHSPEAELRRQFFKDTGVYLFLRTHCGWNKTEWMPTGAPSTMQHSSI